MATVDLRQRADRDIEALLRFEPRDRQQDTCVSGHVIRRIRPPRSRRLVQPVVDHL
jgi:hypothetical protein